MKHNKFSNKIDEMCSELSGYKDIENGEMMIYIFPSVLKNEVLGGEDLDKCLSFLLRVKALVPGRYGNLKHSRMCDGKMMEFYKINTAVLAKL